MGIIHLVKTAKLVVRPTTADGRVARSIIGRHVIRDVFNLQRNVSLHPLHPEPVSAGNHRQLTLRSQLETRSLMTAITNSAEADAADQSSLPKSQLSGLLLR